MSKEFDDSDFIPTEVRINNMAQKAFGAEVAVIEVTTPQRTLSGAHKVVDTVVELVQPSEPSVNYYDSGPRHSIRAASAGAPGLGRR